MLSLDRFPDKPFSAEAVLGRHRPEPAWYCPNCASYHHGGPDPRNQRRYCSNECQAEFRLMRELSELERQTVRVMDSEELGDWILDQQKQGEELERWEDCL